jgi:hypothetical protein
MNITITHVLCATFAINHWLAKVSSPNQTARFNVNVVIITMRLNALFVTTQYQMVSNTTSIKANIFTRIASNALNGELTWQYKAEFLEALKLRYQASLEDEGIEVNSYEISTISDLITRTEIDLDMTI